MALGAGESLTAYSFEFTIDGQVIPDVVAVNNIEQKVNLIENKAMTSTGIYQLMHMQPHGHRRELWRAVRG